VISQLLAGMYGLVYVAMVVNKKIRFLRELMLLILVCRNLNYATELISLQGDLLERWLEVSALKDGFLQVAKGNPSRLLRYSCMLCRAVV